MQEFIKNGQIQSIKINNGKDYLYYRVAPANMLEIVDIAVNTKKGIGIGSCLVEKLLSLYPDKESVFAFCRSTNTKAHGFYKKAGFKLSGILNNFYYDSEDSYVWKKVNK